MRPFDIAWNLLKALPEQQGFIPARDAKYDGPHHTGTIHQAILGMLARQKRDELLDLPALPEPAVVPGEKFGPEELWEQYGEHPNLNLETGPLSEAPVFTSEIEAPQVGQMSNTMRYT